MRWRWLGWLWLLGGLWGCAPAALPVANLPTPDPTTSLSPTPLAPNPTLTPTPEVVSLPAVPTQPLQLPGPGAVLLPPTPSVTPTTTPLPPTAGAARYQIVGFSSQGYALEAWEIGGGPTQVVLVGGIHGGYEWNTILLGYQMVDYFNAFPEAVPPEVTLTIIPAANPDGQARVVGFRGRFTPADVRQPTAPGRFNANEVDLNRNWDCNWMPTSAWGQRTVSGGGAPFSEPETRYLQEFLLARQPALVIFWHSKFPGIFPGTCQGERLTETVVLGELYAAASGYPMMLEGFTEYVITGEASDYLTTVGIPSFTVELATDYDPEWAANWAGVMAVLETFK